MTLECNLSRLTTLVIAPYTDEDNVAALDELYGITQMFLKSIPPLRSLKLMRHYDRAALQVAIESHGQSLQQLLLTGKENTWLITVDTIEMIREQCPVLGELYIPFQRYAGTAKEVAMYHALGSIPTLKRLYLSLHQTDVRFPLAVDLNHSGQPVPTHHDIRNALINFAIDEKLARAIFNTVSSSKRAGSPLLQHLELRAEDRMTANYRGYPFYVLEHIFDYLRRSWTCDLNPQDQSPQESHECVAVETDPEQVLDREYEERYGTYDFALDPEIAPIFRSIWPGDGPWKDRCCSLPLAPDLRRFGQLPARLH